MCAWGLGLGRSGELRKASAEGIGRDGVGEMRGGAGCCVGWLGMASACVWDGWSVDEVVGRGG